MTKGHFQKLADRSIKSSRGWVSWLVLLCFALQLLEAASRGALAATFNSPADVPVTASSYTATGATVNIALNCAPAAGTALTVVNNTGTAFINGTFDNLAQGQMVMLEYQGVTYAFTANYYGGTGNDLVLQWATTALVAWGDGYDYDTNSLPQVSSLTGALAGKTISALAAGADHNLALCTDGTVAGWGNNQAGQLGAGTLLDSNGVPVAVSMTGVLSGKAVIALAAGGAHSLALCSDGTLVSWGSNNSGQLGSTAVGSGQDTSLSSMPAAVDTGGVLSGKTVVALAAGLYHSLALCSDGTVTAWGSNANGELGNNSTSDSSLPVAVDQTDVLAGKQVISVAAGQTHNLALCSDGTMAAWGSNASGELGNNSTSPSNAPVAVIQTGALAGKTVVAISAGLNYSLALCADGTVAAWGNNDFGELGNNTNTQSHVPVAVKSVGVLKGKAVAAIAGGSHHVLAQCSGGTLATWGGNDSSQLGDNNWAQLTSRVPVAVSTSALPVNAQTFVLAASGPCASHNLALLALPPFPHLLVKRPDGEALINGGYVEDFGIAAPGQPQARLFTITNGGTASMTVASVRIDGANAENFTIATAPASTLAVGASTTFTVVFAAGYPFQHNATLHIATSDSDTGVFDVGLKGVITGAGELNATYATGFEIPVSADSFTASGCTVRIALNHDPATGTNLMVVRNTGHDFIHGRFDNLAQGQVVMLPCNGSIYHFVANYYGGGGRDLVLQWAETRPEAWGLNASGQLGYGIHPLGWNVDASGVLAGKVLIALSAGGSHSLALSLDGAVFAWGGNASGQLGNNAGTDSPAPVAVSMDGVLSGKTVIAIAAGASHSLALCADGTLAAWGSNASGQLGIGTTVSSPVPVAVDLSGVLANKRVTGIAAGAAHSLVLCSDGTLVTWGDNGTGQLGCNSTQANSLSPVAVDVSGALAGRTVSSISAGENHCLVLCSDSAVVTWGDGSYGQLGNGGTTSSRVPVRVSASGVLAGKTVVKAAAGGRHNIVLCSDHTLASWGDNGHTQLDDSTMIQRTMPVALSMGGALGSTSVLDLAPGDSHSLVRSAGSPVIGWGNNQYQQTGGTGATDALPATVGYAMPAAVVASGSSASHSLALVALPPSSKIVIEQPAGTVLMNGSTIDFGGVTAGSKASRTFVLTNQGNAPLVIRDVRVQDSSTSFVLTKPPATPLAMGASTTFTITFTPVSAFTAAPFSYFELTTDDASFSINLNGYGAGTAIYKNGQEVPVRASSFGGSGIPLDLKLEYAPPPGSNLMVAQTTGLGFLSTSFSNVAQGQIVPLAYNGVTYSFVANYYGGTGNDLVLQWINTLPFAWGDNAKGELGNNTTTQSPAPVAVDRTGVLAGKTVSALASGSQHHLALCTDGTLAAWGWNASGQLGDNTTTDRLIPAPVDAATILTGSPVIAIAAGMSHNVALRYGSLATWGSNAFGQLGDGSTTDRHLPVPVSLSKITYSSPVAVSAGNQHTLVLCYDGTLVSWGENNHGQLGNNSTSDSHVPVWVPLWYYSPVAIAAGGDHCLVLCSHGTLVTWGANTFGQLGNSSTADSSLPVAVNAKGVLAGKTPSLVAAGGSHNLALCSDGTLVAWGLNADGQLGNNSTTSSSVPVAVSKTGVLAGKKIISIAAGASYSMALCSDGTLAAWGSNAQGQLGNTTSVRSPVPVAVAGGSLPSGARFMLASGGPSSISSLALVGGIAPASLTVQQPAGAALPTEGAARDFGGVAPGTSSAMTFVVKNSGKSPLTGLTIAIDGADASDFSVGNAPVTQLAASASTTLVIKFTPGAANLRTATLRLAGSDGQLNPFSIALTGTGLAPPAIAKQPAAQLVTVGQPVAFSVNATGGILAYQWKKDGTVIPGATASTFGISAATLASAGAYTVKITNTAGFVTSLVASLGVVASTPANVAVVEGKTLSLKAVATGSGLSYRWMKNGLSMTGGINPANPQGVISGTATLALTVTGALPADAGDYCCIMTLPDPQNPGSPLTLPSGIVSVHVTRVPVINAVALGPWIVSGTVTDAVSTENSPTRFTLAGQPPGVSLDSTGHFQGKPVVALSKQTTYTLVITASNAAGISAPVTAKVVVFPLPGLATGSFAGLIERDTSYGNSLGGTLQMNILSTGAATGKLTHGASTYSFLTQHLDATLNAGTTATVIARSTRGEIMYLSFVIDLDSGELSGFVGDGMTGTVRVHAWRTPWKTGSNPAPVAATYANAFIPRPAGAQAADIYPKGAGFSQLAISTDGIATWAGRMADGMAATGSSALGIYGDLPLHSLLNNNTGSMHGWVLACTDNDAAPANNGLRFLDGTVDWYKNPATTAADRIYNAGIPNHDLSVTGCEYVRPTTAILGLHDFGPGTNNATLYFTEGGLSGPPPIVGASMAQFLNISLRITASNSLVMPPGATDNLAGVGLALNAATGAFSGSFILKNDQDPTSASARLLSRTVHYYGQIVPRAGLNQGVGYFLLPELPSYANAQATTLSTSPILSGKVVLQSSY